MFEYYKLNEQTVLSSINWKVHQINNERFSPKAEYTFKVDNKLYLGHSVLMDPVYRNSKSIEDFNKKLNSTHFKVWYSKENPHLSSLQKNFPFKQCISMAILWGLLIYFIRLGQKAELMNR